MAGTSYYTREESASQTKHCLVLTKNNLKKSFRSNTMRMLVCCWIGMRCYYFVFASAAMTNIRSKKSRYRCSIVCEEYSCSTTKSTASPGKSYFIFLFIFTALNLGWLYLMKKKRKRKIDSEKMKENHEKSPFYTNNVFFSARLNDS